MQNYIDDSIIEGYIKHHGISNPTAAGELAEIVSRIAEGNNGVPDQSEFEFDIHSPQGETGVSGTGNRNDDGSGKRIAILYPGSISASDFDDQNLVSAFFLKYIRREIPSFDIRGKVIKKPGDFFALLHGIRSPLFESLKIACLNDNDVVVHSQIVSVGIVNQALIDPMSIVQSIHEAQKIAKTSKVLLAHNHPSGDPTPSSADVKSTREIDEACKAIGINLVDHMVTNGRKFCSAKNYTSDVTSSPLLPWEKVHLENLKLMNHPMAFEEIANHLRQTNPENVHVFYLNVRMKLVCVERRPSETVMDSETFLQKTIFTASAHGCNQIIFDFKNTPINDSIIDYVRKIKTELYKFGFGLIDVATHNSDSLRSDGILTNEETSKYRSQNEFKEWLGQGIATNSPGRGSKRRSDELEP